MQRDFKSLCGVHSVKDQSKVRRALTIIIYYTNCECVSARMLYMFNNMLTLLYFTLNLVHQSECTRMRSSCASTFLNVRCAHANYLSVQCAVVHCLHAVPLRNIMQADYLHNVQNRYKIVQPVPLTMFGVIL